MPDKPQELLVLEQEGQTLASIYMKLEVSDESSLSYAAEALTGIRDWLKKAEGIRKFLVQPLNDHVKVLNDLARKTTEPAREADVHVSAEIQRYRTEKERIRREEQERLEKLAEKRRDKAIANGKPPPIPEAIVPIVESGPRIIATDSGQMQFMRVPKWEVEDADLIPMEYLIPDTAKIGKDVKSGVREIPGIKIWVEEVPVIRGGNG